MISNSNLNKLIDIVIKLCKDMDVDDEPYVTMNMFRLKQNVRKLRQMKEVYDGTRSVRRK